MTTLLDLRGFRATESNLDSPSTFSKVESESRLIEIAHWAIWSMRVPGYFLFTIDPAKDFFNNTVHFPINNNPSRSDINPNMTRRSSKVIESQKVSIPPFLRCNFPSNPDLKVFNLLRVKSSLLQLNFYVIYISFWFLSSVLVTIFSIYKGYDILIQFGNAASNNNFQVFSDVSDRLLATTNVIVMGGFLLIFRLFFLKASQTLQFWKSIVNLYHEFRVQLPGQRFEAIRGEVAKDALWQWPVALIQSGCSILMGLYINHFTTKKLGDMGIGGAISWVTCLTIINCHIGLTIWIGFFIRFYSTCFNYIRTSISNITNSSSTVLISLQNGNFEVNNTCTNSIDILEKLLNLFESVCESVENFNKFYVFALIVDIFIGLSNALATVYQFNRITYESGKVPWEETVLILMKIPLHFLYILRLFYLINLSEDMTQEGLGVLRSLQLVKSNFIGGGVGLLAKIQILVTRVSLHPPSVSPGNYFRLSRRLLASVVSLLATYFIILTELREEDEGRSLIRSLLNNSCIKT